MNRALSAEYLAQVTKFERFLILQKEKLIWASFLVAFAVIAIVAILQTPNHGIRLAIQNARMQTARQIGQCLYSYALDHNGKYPAGKSSTDIFQQLIDQNYVNDPALFYFPMTGKTKAIINKLKPENVCFDVTNGVLSDDSDYLPVVMSTGFKIDYVPSGKALALSNGDRLGIAIFYKGNNTEFKFLRLLPPPPVVSAAFDPKGRTYQQLTPDGPLP